MPTLAQFKHRTIVINVEVFINREKDDYRQRAVLRMLQTEGKVR
jgi:hypothetical protein